MAKEATRSAIRGPVPGRPEAKARARQCDPRSARTRVARPTARRSSSLRPLNVTMLVKGPIWCCPGDTRGLGSANQTFLAGSLILTGDFHESILRNLFRGRCWRGIILCKLRAGPPQPRTMAGKVPKFSRHGRTGRAIWGEKDTAGANARIPTGRSILDVPSTLKRKADKKWWPSS